MSLQDIASRADQQPDPADQDQDQTDQTPPSPPSSPLRPITPLMRVASLAAPPAPPPPTPPQPPPQAPQTSQAKPFTVAQALEPERGSAAARAEPEQPYLGSPRNRPPSEWGKPDMIHQGAMAYQGGVAPGPYMPQPSDFSRMVPLIALGLGRFGSRHVGGSAIGMAAFAQAYVQAVRQRRMDDARLQREQFQESLKETAERQKQESQEYGEAWSLYGPRDGKEGDYDENRMRQAIWNIAHKYGDQRMINVMGQEGLAQAERLMQFRDSHGQDAAKLYTQMLKQQQLDNARRQGELQELRKREAQQKIDRDAAKAREASHEYDPFLVHPGTEAPPTPSGPERYGAPPEATPADPQLEWPDQEPEQGTPKGGGTPAAPGAAPPAAEPEPQAEAEPEPTPPPDEGDMGDQAAAQPQQPVRVASADTGTMSDAPPPEAAPLARVAQAAPAAPLKGRGTQALGAPAPQAPARPTPIPGVRVEAPAEFQPRPSRALADPRTPDGRPLDPQGINTQAQRLVNGALKIQDIRGWPKPYLGVVEARAAEIEAEMDRIQKDPSIKGDGVYRAINKVNPEFAGVLRGYISGDFPVPASAWKNPQYLDRTIGLGQKIDPTFNASTFKIRASTKQSFASGQDARNMTSIATLDFHAQRMLNNLQRVKQLDPHIWQQYLALTPAQRVPFLGRFLAGSPELRTVIAQLDEDSHTVANEAERAITGGKPTVSGADAQHRTMDWRYAGPDAVMDVVREKQALAHERMNRLIERYEAVVGRGRDDLGRLYRGYAGSAAEGASDALGGYGVPDPAVAGHAIEMIRGPQAAAPGAIPPGWTVTPIQ